MTAAGIRFADEAQVLLRQWETSLRAVQDEVGAPKGEIHLGCHTAVAQYTLPGVLPLFLEKYPDIQIRLAHGLSRHLTEQVVSSRLDVAIVVNPIPHPDLVVKELCRDVVTFWRSKQCRNSELLLIEPSLTQTQDLLRKAERSGLHFKSFLESSSLEVLAQLLVAGAGCAILPERVVRAFSSKSLVKLPGAPTFSDRVCLVFRPDFRKTKRGQLFSDAVQASF